jgi:hypothetical protein
MSDSSFDLAVYIVLARNPFDTVFAHTGMGQGPRGAKARPILWRFGHP